MSNEYDEQPLYFGDEGGGGEYDEDDNIDDYESDDDGDFREEDADVVGGGDDGFLPDDKYIDQGAEWRDFGDGANKSRVGEARPLDIIEDLTTVAGDDRFKKLEQMTKTPEDIFRIMSRNVIAKYRNKLSEYYNEGIRVMQFINARNRKLKFKNPAGILFALYCIKDGEISSGEYIDDVYETMAKNENMTKIDLLRYIFFVYEMTSSLRVR
jgi:hypothetical protein